MTTTKKINKTNKKTELKKHMSKSVIKKSKENKSGILRVVGDTSKALQRAKEIHMLSRFLEHEEDKERVAEIISNIQDAQKTLSELQHIVVHDTYWANLRRDD